MFGTTQLGYLLDKKALSPRAGSIPICTPGPSSLMPSSPIVRGTEVKASGQSWLESRDGTTRKNVRGSSVVERQKIRTSFTGLVRDDRCSLSTDNREVVGSNPTPVHHHHASFPEMSLSRLLHLRLSSFPCHSAISGWGSSVGSGRTHSVIWLNWFDSNLLFGVDAPIAIFDPISLSFRFGTTVFAYLFCKRVVLKHTASTFSGPKQHLLGRTS